MFLSFHIDLTKNLTLTESIDKSKLLLFVYTLFYGNNKFREMKNYFLLLKNNKIENKIESILVLFSSKLPFSVNNNLLKLTIFLQKPINSFRYFYESGVFLKARVIYYTNNWIYTTNHKRIAVNYF